MKVLLTNDDGIRAPGIVALHRELTSVDASGLGFGDVFPVAPLTVQSATSHGVTFHEPLMVRGVSIDDRMRGLAVDARPADCVKLALTCLWPERFGVGSRPDLVISGMNAGANCGINVIYSGTVAAALEGAFLGVPSIAVSLMLGPGEPDFACGARHARRAIEAVLAHGPLEAHTCISINIPARPVGLEGRDDELPIAVCPMNTHGLNDGYERRESPSGDVYYWANGSGLDFRQTDPGSDVQRLLDGQITVTPLKYDLTHHEHLGLWRGELGG